MCVCVSGESVCTPACVRVCSAVSPAAVLSAGGPGPWSRELR